MFDVRLKKAAEKYYQGLDDKQASLIDEAFSDLEKDPTWRNAHVVPLRGKYSGHYRYRKGIHRVIYTLDEEAKVVTVDVIVARKDAYR